MNEEKLIHVKLDFADALESKKDILEIEKSFIQISNSVERFDSLRMSELKMKLKFSNKIKELSQSLKNLNKLLPEPKMPKILRVEKKDEAKSVQHVKKLQKEMPAKRMFEHKSIDEQIRDIQNKLNSL